MILGVPDTGSDTLALAADTVSLFDVGIGVLARPFSLASILARLDGNGGGGGEQRIRPVVMAQGDPASVVVGDEFVVAEGMAEAWAHLTFARPPLLPAGAVPLLGVYAGAASVVARLLGTASVGVGDEWTGIAYPQHPDLSGAAGDVDGLASLCALGVEPYAVPAVDDEEIARLPFDVAGRVFEALGPTGDSYVASAGWHWLRVDGERRANAIVRTAGPLADLVGERVRVSVDTPTGPRSVAVYVHDEQPFDDGAQDEDISLSRAAFARIAPLWTDTLTVRVEVLA